MKRIILLAVTTLTFVTSSIGQKDTPNPFDYGKMWTFENPPVEWFKEAYGFDPGQEWFDDVRKSSLRFASWCSASFISAEGLIMTNHHCSRDVVAALQKEGENFDKNGFYAASLSDERRADGLFVEQLVKAVDITPEVDAALTANNTADKNEAVNKIKTKYENNPEWQDLRLQLVTYYSGGKYSLYGYKRYDDIRLVWIPEVDLGFFGGDPDNFTYPRYNLDATFWRAYDDNGLPLNTSANYLKFNPQGAVEGEPVFVVGNPGSTERYRTVAQLEFDRDYRYPMLYKFLKNRNDLMVAEYNQILQDPSKEMEAQAMLNEIAGVANGMKAYGGIVKGLNDDELMGRKVSMEQYIRSKSPGVAYWDELKSAYEKLNPHGWAINHLSPSGLRGGIYRMMFFLNQYEEAAKAGAPADQLEKIKGTILSLAPTIDDAKEQEYFKTFLREIKEDVYPGDNTVDKLLGGKSVDAYVSELVKKTKFNNTEKVEKCLAKTDKLHKEDDPMMEGGRILGKRYSEAGAAFQASTNERKALEAKIANQAFKVFGTSLPPDATFTLRISDGVLKSYDYNGTTAPIFTTYFGLYDRYYSHGSVFPWSLPKKWLNPSLELLKSKLNMISTNDIIGGNSGSPLINKNKEAVGLIFDGNIESLPGNFIFDEKANRTVSVHAGGIHAALRHIYKADRIIAELAK